ncbi:hypothetical protein HYH03_000879 [Edaphochlamys debaryana]|uniref:G10 protein n=1 Tax=Edaphochlamys debaryana TaxID=47281 RepID=A0A835YDU6_9CHLO|nr:hypothetical protein HYH03_000879 [Edaphochlamys debaryana]|eukprot:KAG2501060.1 hypothetical protein HYH03_000879 [Edaphochlamys debaryana]
MSLRRKLKGKKPPEGWELIEEVIEDFEQQLKEAVNEEHEGKRKTELTWKIHRLHWEKNRFIYDLMYQRKVMSRELFEWLCREKVADGALIAKWRKPGYEILCSMLAIQKGNHNFGTTSHCRVPLKARGKQQRITPDVQTGCISCASGDGKFGGPVWWNTPLDDEDGAKLEENRTTWGQGGEGPDVGGPGPSMPPPRKRPADELAADDDDELPPEVAARLEALKKAK